MYRTATSPTFQRVRVLWSIAVRASGWWLYGAHFTHIRCVQTPQDGWVHASGLCHLHTISTDVHTYVGLTISPVHKYTRCMGEYFNKVHTTWMTYGCIPSKHVHYRVLKVCQSTLSVRCVCTAVQQQYRWADESPALTDWYSTGNWTEKNTGEVNSKYTQERNSPVWRDNHGNPPPRYLLHPLARRCSHVGVDSWVPLFECDTELVN